MRGIKGVIASLLRGGDRELILRMPDIQNAHNHAHRDRDA
jgi:hypothetical protein